MATKKLFFPELLSLADNSETFKELVQIKSLDEENLKNINDQQYLELAFSSISFSYIKAMDAGDIVFRDSSDRDQFIWLLGLITDIALGGKLKDFPSFKSH
jgi:hypothetical protein